ncbi:MAG: response regulator transcription factor [Chitinophagaceae bacterium]
MPAFYKVAIVDDHRLLREILSEVIRNFGYDVILECNHGKSFIEQINSEQLPDICLLDYSMPVMDGLATAEYIKEHFPSVKILMYSIKNDPLITRKIESIGVDAYLHKSADLSALRALMYRITSGEACNDKSKDSLCGKDCSNSFS